MRGARCGTCPKMQICCWGFHRSSIHLACHSSFVDSSRSSICRSLIHLVRQFVVRRFVSFVDSSHSRFVVCWFISLIFKSIVPETTVPIIVLQFASNHLSILSHRSWERLEGQCLNTISWSTFKSSALIILRVFLGSHQIIPQFNSTATSHQTCISDHLVILK